MRKRLILQNHSAAVVSYLSDDVDWRRAGVEEEDADDDAAEDESMTHRKNSDYFDNEDRRPHV